MILFFSILLGTVVVDQISKWLVVSNMELGEVIPLIPNFLNLQYITNDGAAMGMLDNARWVFMVFSTVAIAAILFYIFYFRPKDRLILISLSLIAGGGIGNMIDRIYLEYVIDFIDFSDFGFPWIFNLADSFVCIGCGMMILYLIMDIVKDSKREKAEREAALNAENGRENQDEE